MTRAYLSRIPHGHADISNTLAHKAMSMIELVEVVCQSSADGRVVHDADLSCGPLSKDDGYYMALFTRNGTAWQRQGAISRYKNGSPGWALARDGNALFYGNELFTRSNGVWTCP